MHDLDLEVPIYRLAEIDFFERWHWRPSDLDGMPLSERIELHKMLRSIADLERQKAESSAPPQPGQNRGGGHT